MRLFRYIFLFLFISSLCFAADRPPLHIDGMVMPGGGATFEFNASSGSGDARYGVTGTHTRYEDFTTMVAESLGSELVTNGDMEDGFTGGVADGWTEAGNGTNTGTPAEESGAGAYGGSGSSQKYTVISETGNNSIFSNVFSVTKGISPNL